jgi:hypothetical protein
MFPNVCKCTKCYTHSQSVIYGQIVFELGVWIVSMSCFELSSVHLLVLNVCIHHIHIISRKILWQQYCLLWVCFISLLLTSNLCFTSIYSISTNLSTLGSFIQHWTTSVTVIVMGPLQCISFAYHLFPNTVKLFFGIVAMVIYLELVMNIVWNSLQMYIA